MREFLIRGIDNRRFHAFLCPYVWSFLYKFNGLTTNQPFSFHQTHGHDFGSGVVSNTPLIPQNVQNGQSVENVPSANSKTFISDTPFHSPQSEDTKEHWYAVRVTYGRVRTVYDTILNFDEGDVTPYLPAIKKQVYRMIDGKASVSIESRPIHTGLLFVKASLPNYQKLLKATPKTSGLTPFYDHFSISATGRNNYLVVPDRQFDSFRRIIESEHDDILTDQTKVPSYLIGKKVRVIDGLFAGVEGTLLKWKHQRRVFVDLGLFGKYGTGYVRTCDFEIID